MICAGSGNEGASAGHVSGRLSEGGPGQPAGRQSVELAVGNYESTTNVQLWKNFADSFRVILQAPSGQREEVPMTRPGADGACYRSDADTHLCGGAVALFSKSGDIF